MHELQIEQLQNREEIPWDLLLLADPSREVIEAYLPKSQIFLGTLDNKIIGVYVLTALENGVIELKNVAVDKTHQGKGFGKQLIMDAIARTKQQGAKRIEVGTGNSSLLQLALYQKCGFRIVGIEKGFFYKNYKEKIIENGIRCVDMIRLAITF